MASMDQARISPDAAAALLETMRPYFTGDGITLHGWHQDRWLASGAVFRELQTASLARAAGGAVDHWLPRQPQARTLRRLQNEVQMLLYTHPVNDARAAAGQLPINSFWVSGTGPLPSSVRPGAVVQDAHILALQDAALRDDAPAWSQAWQALDSTLLVTLLQQAQAGQHVQLTLCAENRATTYQPQKRSFWSRLTSGRSTIQVAHALQDL